MLFNSYEFIVLLAATFSLYYLPGNHKNQVWVLILASFIFYAWHKPILLLLLIFSCTINALTSYSIVHRDQVNKKTVAWLGVASNLLVLVLFKYGGLVSIPFVDISSVTDFLITLPLPIGISFFTFQGISLVVDVYKEDHFENRSTIPKSFYRHCLNSVFFISFFPQLIAGPIVKAHDFLPQIKAKRIQDIRWEKCFREIVLGFFLKMVVADNLNEFTYFISFPAFQYKDSFSLLALLLGYSCQIFADFAGYSLIAIGIARMFGYNLKDNFNFPYIASSYKEFWKRWHISLSSFLQEYLYIPLGGNRKGKARMYLNLMITMALGGLWHGAAWSYAVWGIFHGVALAVERLLTDNIKVKQNGFITFVKVVLVFSTVSFAWLLFKLPNFNDAIRYVEAISKNSHLPFNRLLFINTLLYSSPVILYHLYFLLKKKIPKKLVAYEYLVYGLMIFLILTNSGIPGEFIYFQF